MKAKTMFLLAGTVGAGAAITGMMRRRKHEREMREREAERPNWRKMAGLVATGAAITSAMRRRKAHKG